MTKLFDTHAHYFAERFNELDGGADAILSSEKFRETVGKVICVGSDPSNVHISTNLARKYALHVIIHNRNAHGDTLDMIRRYPTLRGRFTAKESVLPAAQYLFTDFLLKPMHHTLLPCHIAA